MTPGYRGRHATFAEQLDQARPDDEALLDLRLHPGPQKRQKRSSP
jgi:hypothetical protein